ncbi:heme NO-binding domain-containing protein [Paracoccus aerodenitrificans]|nr:heme NO-binding domain-containing protein [Paracoccus aerodenitrificans]
MHGFVIRGIELFLRARHGDAVWADLCRDCGLDRRGTQILHEYGQDVAPAMIRSACKSLQLGREELLEDIGGWIPRLDSVRHIMRFSGSSFQDFVLSLDDLHDRGSAVLPGLILPRIVTLRSGPGSYRLSVSADQDGWLPVLCGFLRGMADDYGVLAIVETADSGLTVTIIDDSFAEGSRFSMHGTAGAA